MSFRLAGLPAPGELICLRESERMRDLQVVQDAGQDCDRMFRLLHQGAHFGGPRGALLQRYLHSLPRFPKRLGELLREGILKTTKGVLDILAKRPRSTAFSVSAAM